MSNSLEAEAQAQETGALRYDAGKPTFHHIHPDVLHFLYCQGDALRDEPMMRWYFYGAQITQRYTLDYTDLFKVLDFGAKKYASLNYTKGMLYSRVFDSWFRHKYYYPLNANESVDSESGISHEGHANCNLLFALTYEILGYDGGEFDDRPKGLK